MPLESSPKQPTYCCLQGYVSFDNFGLACLQVLQIVTLESWEPGQLYFAINGFGNLILIYYLAIVFFGTYFAFNLLTAVISAKFAQLHVSGSVGTSLAAYCQS